MRKPSAVLRDHREDQRKSAFAERLEAAMHRSGLSLNELTRRVGAILPRGSFSRSNLSHYRTGRSFPRSEVLEALSKVLDVPVEELAPDSNVEPEPYFRPDSMSVAPALRVEDAGEGRVFIQINQLLSWPDALRVLQALRKEEFAPEPNHPRRDRAT